MPRANRSFIPGLIWPITHRCHNRDFLLKLHEEKESPFTFLGWTGFYQVHRYQNPFRLFRLASLKNITFETTGAAHSGKTAIMRQLERAALS